MLIVVASATNEVIEMNLNRFMKEYPEQSVTTRFTMHKIHAILLKFEKIKFNEHYYSPFDAAKLLHLCTVGVLQETYQFYLLMKKCVLGHNKSDDEETFVYKRFSAFYEIFENFCSKRRISDSEMCVLMSDVVLQVSCLLKNTIISTKGL